MVDRGADLGAGDRHAQRLGDLAQAHAQGFGGGAQGGIHAGRAPVGNRRQARAHLRQRRPRGRREVFGHRGLVVGLERAVPDVGAFGHFLQGLHAVAQCHHHVGRVRALRHVVTVRHQLRLEVLRHVLRLVGLEVVLVQPAQLGRVQARGLLVDVLDGEQRLELVAAEDFLVAVRPAKPRQVIHQRMRQVALFLVGHDVGRARTLGEFGALRVEDHRHVREVRHGGTQRLVDVHLARRVVDVVVAADDVGDAHVQVVHHHREVVGGVAVGAEDHQVVEFIVAPLDAALDLVLEHHAAADRVLEADDAVGVVAFCFVAVAVVAVVTRLEVGGHRRLAHGLELFLGFVGVIGGAVGDHLFRDLAVAVQAVGLEDRAFVVVQAQPVHGFQDGVDGGLGAALAVGVFHAQDELATAAARLQVAVQRRAGAADVQETSRAGGEAGAAGHRGGRVGTVGRAFYGKSPAGPAGCATMAPFPRDLARCPCA